MDLCAPLIKELKEKYWGSGPWVNEPDEFGLYYEDLYCAGRRSSGGIWLGYVFIPKKHPWYEMHHNDIKCECHGKLSHSAKHERYWVVGFNCGHFGDYCPELVPIIKTNIFFQSLGKSTKSLVEIEHETLKKTYKDIGFTMNECKNIVLQAIDIQKNINKN